MYGIHVAKLIILQLGIKEELMASCNWVEDVPLALIKDRTTSLMHWPSLDASSPALPGPPMLPSWLNYLFSKCLCDSNFAPSASALMGQLKLMPWLLWPQQPDWPLERTGRYNNRPQGSSPINDTWPYGWDYHTLQLYTTMILHTYAKQLHMVSNLQNSAFKTLKSLQQALHSICWSSRKYTVDLHLFSLCFWTKLLGFGETGSPKTNPLRLLSARSQNMLKCQVRLKLLVASCS